MGINRVQFQKGLSIAEFIGFSARDPGVHAGEGWRTARQSPPGGTV